MNTTNVFVYMEGKKNMTDQPHQIDYGGYVNVASYYGVYWYNLTPTSITVNRHLNDQNWVYVRVTIFQTVGL